MPDFMDAIDVLYEPVVRVLAYYDLFDYPLRAEEIHAFLPAEGVSLYELKGTLADLLAEGRLAGAEGFYYLPYRNHSLVRRRLYMQERGDAMWRIARRVATVMRWIPFIRGIFISGQLCRYIADENSDIDYFIIAASRRLWIVRTFLVAMRRIFLFNNRRYFCTNYFITTDNLLIRERNPYVACEVASLKPIYNHELFHEFMMRNSWIREYYPNFSSVHVEMRQGVTGGERLRGVMERTIPARIADWLDTWLMEATRRFWRRKYPGREPVLYEVSLRTRRDESRAHADDKSPVVLERYRTILRNHGISDA